MDRHLADARARVKQVLTETHARRISFVGHSLGGLVARDMVQRGGGRTTVDDVVMMGTPHYGYYTEPPGDVVDTAFNTGCQSCEEFKQGSHYLALLNRPDPTPGRASYTSLITSDDTVALPLKNQYLPRGPQVTNVLLQDACPGHHVDHLQLTYDDVVLQWVLDALAHTGLANERLAITCPML
jgi:pimeloyl-ACP methyl ester carboxylesterase